ncbi:hypothetical protein PYW08_012562 [Mythimna loreyi]|uniref:Uncharacterized protein n=1 Tax=Mythimna loreyi TaxID=667449 RepID=A0ACC2Q2D3_9NEOP|nr:hypothetical protein PYW08_012562 [Mythimna loreyi]
MDAIRYIGLTCLTLSVILLSNLMASQSTDAPPTDFSCPLMDFPKTLNGTLVHNITRTLKCVNGRDMAGCCITRFFCDFNTSHIDLSLRGRPGFRMPCSDVCCPQNYILPIPLPNLNQTDTSDDDEHDNNSSDSDSDEK